MSRKSVKPFLVVPKTMGRCGSTWFCDMLDCHSRVICLGELFNPALANKYQDILSAWAEQREPGAIMRAVSARNPGAGLAGFKLFREQLGAEAMRAAGKDERAPGTWALREQLSDKSMRVFLQAIDYLLLINRQNLTAALVSEIHANATAQWHLQRRQDKLVEVDDSPIRVDVVAGRDRLRNARRTGVILEQMAAEAGCQVVEVTYEDLLTDAQSCMDSVFRSLGLEPEVVLSNFVKMHNDWLFVANLEEVNRELGPEFGYLE